MRHEQRMTDSSGSDEPLTYCVEMTLPHAALEVRAALDQALHRSDRRIGVTTRGHRRGLYLGILTGAMTTTRRGVMRCDS
jgi:hypothetical protein